MAEKGVQQIEKRPGIYVPFFVIMPDHVHLLVVVERATARVAPTLGQIIGAYKSRVFRDCLAICKSRGETLGRLWQRGYYEHVIRNEADYLECARYIEGNPAARAENAGREI